MGQQTAVDLFIAELKKWSIYESATNYTFKVPLNVFVRMEMEANQMHKEQTKSDYNKGYQDGEIDSLDAKDGDVQFFGDAEQYYNNTYGK
jgi:hypothetical protein